MLKLVYSLVRLWFKALLNWCCYFQKFNYKH